MIGGGRVWAFKAWPRFWVLGFGGLWGFRTLGPFKALGPLGFEVLLGL